MFWIFHNKITTHKTKWKGDLHFSVVCLLHSGGLEGFVALCDLYLVLKTHPHFRSLLEPVRSDSSGSWGDWWLSGYQESKILLYNISTNGHSLGHNKKTLTLFLKLNVTAVDNYLILKIWSHHSMNPSGCWGAPIHPRSHSSTASGWVYSILLTNLHTGLNSCGGGTENNGSRRSIVYDIICMHALFVYLLINLICPHLVS